MSTERSGKSHAPAWTLAIIIAIPVVYLLIAPPIFLFVVKDTIGTSYGEPPWLTSFMTPCRLVPENELYGHYIEWWKRRFAIK
jgi:hypothetical protein